MIFSELRKGVSSVNIGQIEHAVEAIRLNSFALAAKERHISPQALSKTVSELERELGIPLFKRTRRSIEATPFAREFEEKARRVLFEFDQLKKLPSTYLKESSEERIFKLGVSDSSYRGLTLMERDFCCLREEAGIDIKLYRSSSDSCLSAMRQGLVDAIVLPGAANELGFRNLLIHSAQVSVIVDKDNALCKERGISLEEVSDYPIACPLDIRFVRPFTESQFLVKGFVPRFEFVEPRFEDFFSFLRRGGVVFARKGGSIPKDVPSVREVALRESEAFAIPFFLVCKAIGPSESYELIVSFLKTKLLGTA